MIIHVNVFLVGKEKIVVKIKMIVLQILVYMVNVTTVSIAILVLVILDILEKIVTKILMIANLIHVKTEENVKIILIIINVNACQDILVKIVK